MSKPRRPIPVDFVARAPSLSVTAAMQEWSVRPETLYRWEADTGVRCRRLKAGRRPKVRAA